MNPTQDRWWTQSLQKRKQFLLHMWYPSCYSSYKLVVYIYIYMDVVEWARALDVRLSEWCCSVSMVWVQIPSREEQKFDSFKI